MSLQLSESVPELWTEIYFAENPFARTYDFGHTCLRSCPCIWQHQSLDSKAGTALVLGFLPTILVKTKRATACFSEVGGTFLLLLLSSSSYVLLFLIKFF